MNKIQVAIVMGSASDKETMQEAARILKEFEVLFEMRIMSAHRTPDTVHTFVRSAAEQGVKVFIAGAGKAAHLAGVVASITTRPVIGVPMTTSDLGGLDSLLSTVQMPPGIPVATTAIGKSGARNAALLAIAMLGLADDSLAEKLKIFREAQAQAVAAADKKLQQEL
ncbi:5-(carboxyamino)imidazole ribonucleotide mutase [bacterium]|nr:5-(carboxyamino)imidazole ribonucleotide mutase [bacterium]